MMRRLFERFALVPDGIVVAIAMVLMGLLMEPVAASEVRSVGLQKIGDHYAVSFSVSTEAGETPIKDFHLVSDHPIGGDPDSPPNPPGRGGGTWTPSRSGNRVTWRLSQTNQDGIPVGSSQTFTLNLAAGAPAPTLDPTKWITTSDGNTTPRNVVDKSENHPQSFPLYVPRKQGKAGLVGDLVNVVPAGTSVALLGNVPDHPFGPSGWFYFITFSLQVAPPPTTLGPLELPLVQNPYLFIGLMNVPFIQGGSGYSDEEGFTHTKVNFPSGLPSGLDTFWCLVLVSPRTGETLVSDPEVIEIR